MASRSMKLWNKAIVRLALSVVPVRPAWVPAEEEISQGRPKKSRSAESAGYMGAESMSGSG